MKVIRLIKDKVLSIRVNTFIKDKLSKEGYTVQSFLDEKLDEKFETVTIIKVKK